MASGAYATLDTDNTSGGGQAVRPRKNTVFSLAALESLDSNGGFRSGVFGLKTLAQ